MRKCPHCNNDISEEAIKCKHCKAMVNEPLMEARGVNGSLELLENKIRIKRQGALAFIGHGLKGDKDILIKQISSIQFKSANMLTNGYIQFTFLGGQEAKGALFQATMDENSIMFSKSQQKSFETIKEAIEKKISMLENSGTKSNSNLDELEKLAMLKEKGIITEKEFNDKKKQLLGI